MESFAGYVHASKERERTQKAFSPLCKGCSQISAKQHAVKLLNHIKNFNFSTRQLRNFDTKLQPC